MVAVKATLLVHKTNVKNLPWGHWRNKQSLLQLSQILPLKNACDFCALYRC
jgi:hypothetical protein